MCSSKKYPYPPTEGNGNSEGKRVQKELMSEGVGGCLPRIFSRDLNKTGEVLINNSFSVQ